MAFCPIIARHDGLISYVLRTTSYIDLFHLASTLFLQDFLNNTVPSGLCLECCTVVAYIDRDNHCPEHHEIIIILDVGPFLPS